jgi:hypothetical protein
VVVDRLPGPYAGVEHWRIADHFVWIWPGGDWDCDCEHGRKHGHERFNPCTHTIIAATFSDIGPDPFTLPPPRLLP